MFAALAGKFSIGTLLSIAKLLLGIVDNVQREMQSRKDYNAGVEHQLSASLIVLSRQLKTFKEIDEKYAGMTDEEIKKDVENTGGFRD